jgi:Family of unknown function (DUF6424)
VAASGPPGTHTEAEDDPWKINIPDHPGRTDSPTFVAARSFANDIMKTLDGDPYGPGPWQMHHGGSLWTYDGAGWFLVLNTLGSEWSAQWCAEPGKVDLIRRNAIRHYAGFPRTIPQMVAMGYRDAETILNTPVTDPQTLGVYVDSVFNSCVPLAAIVHVGVLSAKSPYGGIHHYPKPIVDIQFFKRDDFILWVVDSEGKAAAVTPLAPRGSGDGRVQVVYAEPGSKLDAEKHAQEEEGKQLVLPPNHPLAAQAYRLQM